MLVYDDLTNQQLLQDTKHLLT